MYEECENYLITLVDQRTRDFDSNWTHSSWSRWKCSRHAKAASYLSAVFVGMPVAVTLFSMQMLVTAAMTLVSCSLGMTLGCP